jgi:hypothetical protein
MGCCRAEVFGVHFMNCVGSVCCEILRRRKLPSQEMPDNERHTHIADMGLADIARQVSYTHMYLTFTHKLHLPIWPRESCHLFNMINILAM